MIKLTHR